MRSPDLNDVERIEALLRGMPPETEREARLEGFVRELRNLPPAPPLARERVRTLRGPARRPFAWRPALVALPVALAMIAAAVAVRGEQSGGEEAAREVARGHARFAPAPATTELGATDRAQEWDVSMELRVPHNDRLSDATADAVRITRELGGFVVSSSVRTSGPSGQANLVVRVPSRRVQEAIARLTELGTITGQQVSIQDRQDELDRLGRRIDSLRVQIADLNARLAEPGLSEAQRLRLELRLQRARAELNAAAAQRRGVAREVALAEISLTVRTGKPTAAASEGRFEDAARDAWAFLARAAAVVLFLLIVLSPLLALGVATVLGRRAYRRRVDERLLDKPRPAPARE